MAENEHGTGVPCETKQSVRISECPGVPESITISNITDTSATVIWTKPEHDGGNQITGYVIEMSQKGGFEAWKVAGSTKMMKLTVNKLNTGKNYMFRVRAQVGNIHEVIDYGKSVVVWYHGNAGSSPTKGGTSKENFKRQMRPPVTTSIWKNIIYYITLVLSIVFDAMCQVNITLSLPPGASIIHSSFQVSYAFF